ncbi:O-Antigen ligase [Flavobacterium resistens]|uniref:O-Antigen ligase n=1 Tax=Flavobacterium resistens TaxID=443612 RepID=A0A521DU49_9FLAO|nr:O-antigen ligase family protein [Flavobacterium resistens]MRX68168.1 hypothetical protein [Flavobacterium resistens]SMO75165.1 O-Antigen ligase [Flavobacterium resistens]
MGKILFILITLFLSTQIVIQKRYKKLIWFFIGILFIPLSVVVIEYPYTNFPRFIIVLFCLCFFIQNSRTKTKFNQFPLSLPLLITFVCFFLIGLFDERIDFASKIMRPIYYFLENFIVVFLAYFYIKSLNEVKKIYNFILVCFCLFTIYGIVNYITKYDSYSGFIAEIYKSVDYGNRYTINGDSRFRIASFAWHPIYYGFLLSNAILIVALVFMEKRMQIYSRFFYIIVLFLLSLNLFWTNSRTPLLALIMGLSFFYLFAVKAKSKIRIALVGVIAIVSIVSISPESLKLIDESINTFTSKGSKLEGSSLEMRQVQMAASVIIFNKSPYFGNGFNYISEDLGYSTEDDKRSSDIDFAGFESYIYKLLIEQGSIGIFANLFFFIYLFNYLFKMRKKVDLMGKRLIYLTISMTISFLSFIIGTSDMGSFMVFMTLLGVNLKGIQLSSKKVNSSFLKKELNLVNS